ncbi:protein Atg16l2 isoform X2 [Crotalus tigris]|uniref:protein Atg16l2 isoform X2 n=1 Tax=Crotalus tigris TaxID=88082 RepID=UPI00192F36CC|nr:protein Atg16l2 isoform X2 [Crotalus tigris]
MAEGGSGRRRWKRHIVRQLQQRDRAQKARFSDLVQAYTKLLEKSSLDHCSVQFQIPSVDPQTGGPACSPNRGCPACVPNAVWDSAILLRCLQNRHKAELSKLETANGELAYKIYEWGRLLRAKDAELEDQTDRLAALSRQLCDLEDWRCRLRSQAEEWSRRNGARKAAYDSLQRRFQQQDGELRQALEKGEELLQPALQRKADWARRENDRIERAKQTQLTRELQAATQSTLGLKIESEKVKTGEQKSAGKHPPEEKKGGEKLCKRPFRSASASSLSTPRYKGFLKGWFDFRLKRGNSVSSGSMDQYGSLPFCMAACLPSCVADEQEGHLSEIHAVAFSPNSGLLATGGVDRVIKLWSVAGGCLEEKQTLDVSSGSITSIAFDPSGCCILAATYDNAAQLWKVEDRKIKEILTGHTNKVTAAKFRSTWHQAVTGSRDRTVKEWDLVKGACSRTIEVISCCYDVVCCNNVIVSGHYDKMIRFWDTSPDKRYALAGSSSGTLFLWNLATGKLEMSLAGVHRSSVNAVAWGPSGVHIGSVDKSRKVVLWK